MLEFPATFTPQLVRVQPSDSSQLLLWGPQQRLRGGKLRLSILGVLGGSISLSLVPGFWPLKGTMRLLLAVDL